MRTLILALLLLPLVSAAQKTNTYIKLTDASGQQIKSDAMERGFERNIGVLSFAAAEKTTLSFRSA